MKKWFFSLTLFLGAWSLQAHQVEISSTMLVEQDNSKWVLQIRSALTSFDYAIEAAYPPYKSPEEFRSLVLQHIQDNLQITFNEEDDVMLQNGAVKLGHETSVVFEVVGVPEIIKSVYVENTSFKTIHRSQNALLILKKDFQKKQFLLNDQNDYALYLKADNTQFIPATPKIMFSKISTNYIYAGVGLLLAGLIVGAFLWTRYNRQNFIPFG